MMMRGSKEQHDAIFQTDKRVESVQDSSSTISRESNGENVGEAGQHSTACDAIPEARILPGIGKIRCRFDARIGGWRRVY